MYVYTGDLANFAIAKLAKLISKKSFCSVGYIDLMYWHQSFKCTNAVRSDSSPNDEITKPLLRLQYQVSLPYVASGVNVCCALHTGYTLVVLATI